MHADLLLYTFITYIYLLGILSGTFVFDGILKYQALLNVVLLLKGPSLSVGLDAWNTIFHSCIPEK